MSSPAYDCLSADCGRLCRKGSSEGMHFHSEIGASFVLMKYLNMMSGSLRGSLTGLCNSFFRNLACTNDHSNCTEAAFLKLQDPSKAVVCALFKQPKISRLWLRRAGYQPGHRGKAAAEAGGAWPWGAAGGRAPGTSA